MNGSVAFITSNMMSLFRENESQLFKNWQKAFFEHILSKKAGLIVIAFQDFAYLEEQKDAQGYLKHLWNNLKDIYPTFVSFTDYCDNGDNSDNTALCTVFLASRKHGGIELFDFNTKLYQTFLEGFHVFDSSTCKNLVIKTLFDTRYEQIDSTSSRGYLINRLKIGKRTVDVVNLYFMLYFNSFACPNLNSRRGHIAVQISYIFEKLSEIESKSAALCGDFNISESCLFSFKEIFESVGVVRFPFSSKNNYERFFTDILRIKLSNMSISQRTKLKEELNRVEDISDTNQALVISKSNSVEREEDIEDSIYEMKIWFGPTFCFSCDINSSLQDTNIYHSWSDRILLKGEIAQLVEKTKLYVQYVSFGHNSSIGEKKPVSLVVPIRSFQ